LSANSNYELGRGDKTGGWKPRPVPSLENVKIIQIASGGYHSLALTGMLILHQVCFIHFRSHRLYDYIYILNFP